MCLSNETHEEFSRLARAMDDERLHSLDHHYRVELGPRCNTVDLELHSIVLFELEARRQQRIRRFNRSLWLSSRRGRLVEAIKQWLVRRGLWSSARTRVVEPPDSPMFVLIRLLVRLLQVVRLGSQQRVRRIDRA